MQVCHLPWFMCMYIWSYFLPIPEVDSLSSCLWAYLQPAWYSITCLSYSEYNGTNAQMLHFQSMERAFVPACGDEDSCFCCWIDHAGLCFGYQKMGWCLCCFLRIVLSHSALGNFIWVWLFAVFMILRILIGVSGVTEVCGVVFMYLQCVKLICWL